MKEIDELVLSEKLTNLRLVTHELGPYVTRGSPVGPRCFKVLKNENIGRVLL
jgi:hypothetical protein